MLNNRKFKSLLISPKFQLKVIGVFVSLFVLNTLVLYLGMLHFFSKFDEMGQKLSLPPHHSFYKFLSQQQSEMLIILFSVTTIILILMILFGFLLSHKIAGPMYRLSRHIVAETEKLSGSSNESISPIKFRKNDFFLNVQDEMNDFFNQLNKK